MKKVSLISAIALMFHLVAIGQMETKINPALAKGPDNFIKPKKEVQAFSYRLGNLDLCTIAPIEEETIYRIQFTVLEGFYNDFNQFAAERAYGDVFPEYVLNKNLTRYMIGDFIDLYDAKEAHHKIVDLGHTHAFVVKYKKGMRQE